jgi:hypothetical protein
MSITRICSGAWECGYGAYCAWWREYHGTGDGKEPKENLYSGCSGNKHKMVKCIYIIGHRNDDE